MTKLNTKKIIDLYKSQLLTQEDLCEKAGVSLQALSSILRGKSDPQISTLIKIASALNCKIGFLLDEVDNNVKSHSELLEIIQQKDKLILDYQFVIDNLKKMLKK